MHYFENARKLLKLATPLIVGNLGIVLVGFGDVFVAARYSTDVLASVSIANSILMNIFLFGVSLLSAISPLLSNFRGEKIAIKKYFYPTIEFSMILATIICILSIATIPLVDYLGFEDKLIPDIKKYMFVCSFSNFGVYLFVGLKEYLQAFEIVIFPNILNIFCVFLNLYLNFVFVFGWYGLPEYGALGLAIATTISRLIIGIILFLWCLKLFKLKFYRDISYFKEIIKMGLPISGAVLIEVAAWNAVTVFVARISGLYAAIQSILCTLTNATFMIPMAIANAISVKVGFENGAKNFEELKRYAFSGLGMSVGFMTICAIIFLLFPTQCIKIFSNDNNLVASSIPILMLIAFYQIFDGLQISLGGIFKGLKNTNIIMIGNFIAYWVIGLPIGYILAFGYNLKLFGFWVGLTLSIASLGTGLFTVMIRKFKQLKN